jgi:hypothetical protein
MTEVEGRDDLHKMFFAVGVFIILSAHRVQEYINVCKECHKNLLPPHSAVHEYISSFRISDNSHNNARGLGPQHMD